MNCPKIGKVQFSLKSSAQPNVNLATVVKGEKSKNREGAGINSSANPNVNLAKNREGAGINSSANPTVNPAIVNPTNTAQNTVLP